MKNLLVLACLASSPACCLILATSAQAQIASPSNAGQNSGNNASGSSESPISTPNFSQPTPVSDSPDVSVAPDGTISASPEVIAAVDGAVLASVESEQSSILAQVVDSPPPSGLLTGAESLIPDVSVGVVGAGTPELVSFAQLPSSVEPLSLVGQVITVSRVSTGTSGTIAISETGLVATSLGQSVEIVVSSTSQLPLIKFASTAIVIGLAPSSIALGSQLVLAGATPSQSLALMSGLQGLARQSTLTSLSSGISAFNAIVNSVSDSALVSLSQNPVFTAARTTLQAARAALASSN